MTANHHLCLLAVGLVMIGWSSRLHADDEVTIYGVTPASSSASEASSAVSSAPASSSGSSTASTSSTTHHRHHKTSTASSTTTKPAATVASTDSHSYGKKKTAPAAPAPTVDAEPIIVVSSSNATGNSATAADTGAPMTIPIPPANLSHPTVGAGPAVETGLPVPRPGSTPVYGSTTFPHYQVASAFPLPSGAGYLPTSHVKSASDTFSFTNFEKRRNVYPWKYNIITTVFWIGEGGSPISSTDNVASAWDANWRQDNHGTDNPYNRDGFAPADHAAMINPFYVALPFNDLAFPDKARRWLPAGWARPPKDGKQVSACKDRWVEIKNAQGETCYAQWEDVGPLRYDHAEYVFGNERPDTYTRAGLDVSPAVAQYLNITGKNRLTRWRFVDDADVQPGAWLQYDEQALLLNAIKNTPSQPLPIRSARAPIDDQSDIDSNQKIINKAKG